MIGRTSKWSYGCALLVVMIGGLGACGGSSKSASPTTTSTVPGALDPSADVMAKQAAIAVADLGAGWTQYRKAGGFRTSDAKACSIKLGSGLKASDRIYVGPMFRDQAKQSYFYSFAYVFRTEAGAKAYTAVRRRPEFTQCAVAQDDKAAKQADAKTFVRIETATDPAVGETGGLESFYQEEAGKKVDGADQVSAGYARYAFRHGRVVYVINLDTGLASDEAGRQALGARLSATLASATTAIDGRLGPLDN